MKRMKSARKAMRKLKGMELAVLALSFGGVDAGEEVGCGALPLGEGAGTAVTDDVRVWRAIVPFDVAYATSKARPYGGGGEARL